MKRLLVGTVPQKIVRRLFVGTVPQKIVKRLFVETVLQIKKNSDEVIGRNSSAKTIVKRLLVGTVTPKK